MAVGDEGVVLSSKNSGETWNKVTSSAISWLTSIVAVTENNFLAVGDNGVIISSKDDEKSINFIAQITIVTIASLFHLYFLYVSY
jgi:photosystem II stability/assembly factor-like uncharacterized protein